MYQILILIAVITFLYIIAKSAKKPKANLLKKSTEIVKCRKCGLNLPESEAIQSGEGWLCSFECQT